MKIVMAAVDGSAPALKGVFWAAQIAKGFGAELELVYVSFPNLLPPSSYANVIAQIEIGEAERAARVLDGAERSVADLGVVCRKVRKVGGPAEELADLAERDAVWGVVIGAVGHHAVSRVLLGSVADRLVHICKKPVLVVR
jgi:nucleotide-binding universal stress UspA family protein